MKPLPLARIPRAGTEECAAQLLEIVPAIMRTIRGHMRRHSAAELSVVQFRTLALVSREPGRSISDVAEFIGLTLPSASKLVQGLLTRRYLRRRVARADRRRSVLELTEKGSRALLAARQATRHHLAGMLRRLPPEQTADLQRAMESLRPIFLNGTRSPAFDRRD